MAKETQNYATREREYLAKLDMAQQRLVVTKCHDILNSVGDRFVCGRCKFIKELPNNMYVCEQLNLSRPNVAQDYCSRGEWRYTKKEIEYLAKRKRALEKKKAREKNFGENSR